FMSFFVKAATEALKRFPGVNASIDGNDIVYHGYQDIGVAVSSDHGEHKRGFFGWFNRKFIDTTHGYERGVTSILKHRSPYLLLYVVIVIGMAWLFTRIPTSFLPDEDQGVLFAQVQTPPGSTAERTQKVVDHMREYLLDKEGQAVSSVFTVTGFNFAGRGQSSGMAFIMMKPWEERPGSENSVFAVAERAQHYFFSIKDAMVFAFAPPAVLELGNATGFDIYLQDQAGVGHEALMQARNQFLQLAAQNPVLQRVRPNGLNDEPQYQLLIDDEKASALGVSLADINNTISIAWGSKYINDFIDRGRVKKVYAQGEPGARMSPEDLAKWYVRNSSGEMVPFTAFATGKWAYGSPKLARYNGVPAMEILGEPAPGRSTGEAMAAVEEIVQQLPKGVGYSWTGLSYEERLAGSQTTSLFVLSAIVVFLCLAALYESWSIPFSVMLVVPLGIIGALLATSMRGLSNDVFFKVGLLTTIGLSAKNAILIVEFAKELHEREGKHIVDAAIEACRMRLRPIVMTSLAFILGVVPLAISSGAGSGSQHAIGTGVIGGMVTATVLAIFWVPLFYVVVSTLFKDKASKEQASTEKGH
ncbi:efflux RND transporter permease subunit, partial [Pseudomonas citronellolis]|uniref:efflux RND transporter permease subunit n=1 Tax=Pseudomonas citronellolis TaxID=53408 RepID=UPI002649E556